MKTSRSKKNGKVLLKRNSSKMKQTRTSPYTEKIAKKQGSKRLKEASRKAILLKRMELRKRRRKQILLRKRAQNKRADRKHETKHVTNNERVQSVQLFIPAVSVPSVPVSVPSGERLNPVQYPPADANPSGVTTAILPVVPDLPQMGIPVQQVPALEDNQEFLVDEPIGKQSYHSLFSPDSDSARVRVNTEIWKNIRKKVPSDYIIPDPLFMELITNKYQEGINKPR